MALYPREDRSMVFTGTGTVDHRAQAAGQYLVKVQASNQMPDSGLVLAIKQNGVLKKNSGQPAADQDHLETQIVLNCASNALITVQISSSNEQVDSVPNATKSIINISRIG